MEASLGYLEAVAFSHGYQAIMAGLKLTKLVLNFNNAIGIDKTQSKEEALQALDQAYASLRQQMVDKE